MMIKGTVSGKWSLPRCTTTRGLAVRRPPPPPADNLPGLKLANQGQGTATAVLLRAPYESGPIGRVFSPGRRPRPGRRPDGSARPGGGCRSLRYGVPGANGALATG
eukprot:205110-Hanusia_phi.AAC.1